MGSTKILSVSGGESDLSAFRAVGGESGGMWSHRDFMLAEVVDEGSHGQKGLPGSLFTPSPVLPHPTTMRLWLQVRMDALEPAAVSSLSEQFPALTFTLCRADKTGQQLTTTRRGRTEFDDFVPGYSWVLLFLPERHAAVCLANWGMHTPLHALEVGASLRQSISRLNYAPPTVVLNHGDGRDARVAFQDYIALATASDRPWQRPLDQLNADPVDGIPLKRAVSLSVPLHNCMLILMEPRSAHKPAIRNLRLLRAMAEAQARGLPADELYLHADWICGRGEGERLVRLLPAVLGLDDDALGRLDNDFSEGGDFATLEEVLAGLEGLLIETEADGLRLTIPEFRDPDFEWRDFQESLQDRLYSMTQGSSPGLVHTLVVDAGYGKYMQFMCSSEGITAEVSGPSQVEEGVGWSMGRRISVFYNGTKGDVMNELGFELLDPDENFVREYDAQEWARAGTDACRLVREVFDAFPGDVEATIG